MFGRDDDTWERLTNAGLQFLLERARLGKVTTYTELNATLVRRTGLRGFDFDRADERAAMGHLLGLIVARHYHPQRRLMISALVHYLDANDAGPGFYSLAADLGLLPRNATQDARMMFWVTQLNRLHTYYAGAENRLGGGQGEVSGA